GGDAAVDGQGAGSRKVAGSLQQCVQLALVVRDAARVQPAVADRCFEGRRVPEVERRRRLDVEVSVDEDGRGPLAVHRGAQLADRQWTAVPVDDLTRPAETPNELADPPPRAPPRPGVPRLGADARNTKELPELGEERAVRNGHGGRVYRRVSLTGSAARRSGG